MPSTIPYDPSLVLGNVVDPARIADLEKIAEIQKPVDAAQRELDEYILSMRSLNMTVQEMINMNVDQDNLNKLSDEIEKLKTAMAASAVTLGAAVIKAQSDLKEARDQQDQKQISEVIESPIDYNASAIKKFPLSADSMVMDAQYFRYESDNQTQAAHASSIATYISHQTSSFLSPSVSTQMSAAAKKSMEEQHANHNIEGTIVLTANCTHQVANVFAPFVLDPEKGIRAWNVYVPDQKIDPTDRGSMETAITGAKAEDAGMYLLSGATYGSSFVAMVHLLQDETTDQSSSSSDIGGTLSAAISKNLVVSNMSGKFGLSSEFSKTLNNLLSTSNIQNHASCITMGIIPSIKSNAVASTVNTLNPDPQQIMAQLGAIQGATEGTISGNTSEGQAATAKNGQSFMTLKNDYVTNVVSALGDQDTANNQVIDTNSMMTAFDDYVQKAIAGGCGVPITYFLKPITSRQLAEAYLAKFAPGEFVEESSGDDNATGPSDQGGSGGATGGS